jgi:pyruvate/2-oxoglutarate dehydrogenase complex dihydrolipoamide acyltransferase (E2) component
MSTTTTKKSGSRTKAIVGGVALGIVVLGAIGAITGGGSKEPAAAARTQAAVTVQAPAPAPVTVTAAPAPAQAPAPATSSAAEPVKIPMPEVVGMNLEAAQDLIQTGGVFFSRSEDATGAGRMQILDRDWVVVSQTPAAGELIGEGDAVLSVVKIGEAN